MGWLKHALASVGSLNLPMLTRSPVQGTCLSMKAPSKGIRVDSPSDWGHLCRLEFKPVNFPCTYAIHRHSCFTSTPCTSRSILGIHSRCDKG